MVPPGLSHGPRSPSSQHKPAICLGSRRERLQAHLNGLPGLSLKQPGSPSHQDTPPQPPLDDKERGFPVLRGCLTYWTSQPRREAAPPRWSSGMFPLLGQWAHEVPPGGPKVKSDS